MEAGNASIDQFGIMSMVGKMDVPVVSGDDGSIICFTNNDASKKCFVRGKKNEVKCNDNECFVSYKTMNQRVVGHGSRIRKLGLDVLLMPDGISTPVMIIGKFPKNNLSTLKKILGKNLNVVESPLLPDITTGIPEPPQNCHLFPFTSNCTPYIKEDDMTWIPGIGLKRNIDIFNDPREIFKSEIQPSINLTGKLFKKNSKKTDASDTAVLKRKEKEPES
jgi:hypothetical protein